MDQERHHKRGMFLLLFVAVVLIAGLLVWNRINDSTGKEMFSDAVSQADYTALKTENTLLKKMLGQIQVPVVILGPASIQAGNVAGRLVWDKSVQAGYLYVDHLPEPRGTYSLWIQEEDSDPLCCGLFTAVGDGVIQVSFQSPKPIFKAHGFFIAKGSGQNNVIARGSLP